MSRPADKQSIVLPSTSKLSRGQRLLALGLLILLTCAAFAVHGYHLGIEDEAIYLPAIKKLLNPSLFPYDADFFMGQARYTALPFLVVSSVRLTHASLVWAEFGWQFAALFLMLFGCYRVARSCFPESLDQWGGVALVAILLTLPVAGTGLYLGDQHLHPRTLSTAAILFSIVDALDRRVATALAWSGVAFVIHPLMAIFGFSLVVLIWLPLERWSSMVLDVVPIPFFGRRTSGWREAVATRDYYFLRNWEWYEWLGIFAPVAIVWWIGLIITVPPSTEFLAPLQPMRYLHLVYTLMTIFIGGLLTHYVLRDRVWRWALLLLPLSAGMFFAQRSLFPTSHHIDWPFVKSTNKWVEAFLWVRNNTPRDAYFVLDPNYMSRPGEENYGFRALAERSQIADYSKDAAVVTVSPALGTLWQTQVRAIDGFQDFNASDFQRLRQKLGVNFVLRSV
jgi:hypothetical protein